MDVGSIRQEDDGEIGLDLPQDWFGQAAYRETLTDGGLPCGRIIGAPASVI
jgi:hypothetical protein